MFSKFDLKSTRMKYNFFFFNFELYLYKKYLLYIIWFYKITNLVYFIINFNYQICKYTYDLLISFWYQLIPGNKLVKMFYFIFLENVTFCCTLTILNEPALKRLLKIIIELRHNNTISGTTLYWYHMVFKTYWH